MPWGSLFVRNGRAASWTLAVLALGLSPAPARAQSTLPDPLKLLPATTLQVPLTPAYNALNVPARAAGSFYLDPTTAVKVYKLTSATFPAASANWGHDYSEGGDEVSLPHTGQTRSVLVRENGGPWWLVDFTPGVGVGNARPLTGNLAPLMDLAFTFSNNPAAPYYAYVSDGSTIRRFDVRTMTEAPGNGWPVTGETSAMWLHQAENDSFFTWMRGANGNTIVGYEPSSGLRKTYTNASLNEPRIDRAGRYVGVSMTGNRLVVWDWLTNSVAWSTSGDPGIPFAHNASLRRRWLCVDWNMSYPPDFTVFRSDVPNSAQHIAGPANGTLIHGNGNWIQNPANLDDQWGLFLHYGSLRPAESYWLAPGGMVLITPNSQRRLLGHAYNTTNDYAFYSFAKFSPDGRYVMFTSDMNGSGRSDVFLAELPVTGGGADTTPPSVSVTAPAAGSVVSGAAVTVSATASDNVGVAGVQFKLDGANLGGEDTSAPYGISWNSTLAGNGSHTLTALARDAAGNRTTSLAVTVTVSNADTTPPVISFISATSTSGTTARIDWTTNEASDSQVEYGTTTAYGRSTTRNPSLVTSHSQPLSGLLPATLYHYRVKSRDAAGNLAVAGDFTFTTRTDTTATVSPTSVPPGGAVTVTVAGGPGNTTDWVGLHRVGAADNVYLDWKYLSDTRTAPSPGRTSAVLHFNMPTTAGTYEFRFFAKNGYTKLATSPTVTVTGAGGGGASLSVSPSSVPPGGAVTVTVAGGPGNTTDWVGLHRVGAADNVFLDWKYLSDTRTAPSPGRTSATLHFNMPTTAGTYELRFFRANGYTRLAISPSVTVY